MCESDSRKNGEREKSHNPSTILATISRWISDEPPKIVYARPGGHAERVRPFHHNIGHLARGFIDHLVPEPHRAGALVLVRASESGQDRGGLVHVRLPRREHLVDRVDLARMDRPFAVASEHR